jgi:predicted nucleotidyltransferase
MSTDFADLLRALCDAEVRFLVVGAYAVAFHARPRGTDDLDVWVEPTPENARRVMEALRRFGAPLAQVAEMDFSTPDTIVQIGVAPVRVDMLTSLADVSFEEAWSRRREGVTEGIRVPVIGREDLIRSKRAAGRLQDLLDLKALEGG